MIEVKAIRNEDKNGYKYKVYYGGVEVEYFGLKEGDYLINSGKFYLLEDNKNKAFVLVNEIGVAVEVSRYLVLIFDINGNILMSEVIVPLPGTDIEVSNNTIIYSYETMMMPLGNLSNCELLEIYLGDKEDNYVVSGDKEIKYSNGELSVVKDTKKTIGDYKSSCN